MVFLFFPSSTTMPCSYHCVQLLEVEPAVAAVLIVLAGEWRLCGVHGLTGWPLTRILNLWGKRPYGKCFSYCWGFLDQANKMKSVIDWSVDFLILSPLVGKMFIWECCWPLSDWWVTPEQQQLNCDYNGTFWKKKSVCKYGPKQIYLNISSFGVAALNILKWFRRK